MERIWGRKKGFGREKMCNAANREVLCGLWVVLRPQSKQRGREG